MLDVTFVSWKFIARRKNFNEIVLVEKPSFGVLVEDLGEELDGAGVELYGLVVVDGSESSFIQLCGELQVITVAEVPEHRPTCLHSSFAYRDLQQT